MPLKPQSIRKGIIVKINDIEIEKDQVMVKQGGKFKIQGNLIEIIPSDYITNSKGEKHSNITVKSPGPDDRF